MELPMHYCGRPPYLGKSTMTVSASIMMTTPTSPGFTFPHPFTGRSTDCLMRTASPEVGFVVVDTMAPFVKSTTPGAGVVVDATAAMPDTVSCASMVAVMVVDAGTSLLTPLAAAESREAFQVAANCLMLVASRLKIMDKAWSQSHALA